MKLFGHNKLAPTARSTSPIPTVPKSLLEDLKENQIKIIEAKVVGAIDSLEEKPKITYKIDEEKYDLIADFMVDARGRFTPFKDEYI